ncbi:MAG: YraN family protein [Clostridia bacterium]|nr:YraN family protein [Clostridia bacterium]MDE7328136.1 YraN family protein [Clostridia bacterium]
MNTKEAGIEGENTAVKYLKKSGYKILERNFSVKTGEIDIIAQDKNYIVFVEVKARESLKFGSPIESVTRQKVRSIVRTAQCYLRRKNMNNAYCRFDVIEVLRGEVNHVKNAFEMSSGY